MAYRNDPRNGLIVDTDIGFDPDDFFALLLLLKTPEAAPDLIVTGDERAGKRAAFTKEILRLAGRTEIPVAAGADLGNEKYFCADEVLPDLTDGDEPADCTEALKRTIDQFDRVTYLGLQGFTNIARLIRKYPEASSKIELVQMAGAIGFSRYPGWVQHNIRIDIPSTRDVFASSLPISLVMTQTTVRDDYHFDDGKRIVQRIKESTNPIHQLLWKNIIATRRRFIADGKGNAWPYAHDPLTASVALGKEFVVFDEIQLSIDERGNTIADASGRSVRASHAEPGEPGFMEFLEDRIFGDLS